MSANVVMSGKATEAARGLTHRQLQGWLRELDIPKGKFDEQPARELLNLHNQNKSRSRTSCQVSRPEPFADGEPSD